MERINHHNPWFFKAYPDLTDRLDQLPLNTSHEVKPSKRGEPTLRIGSMQLHSAYDPVREAESLTEQVHGISANDIVTVFGLGLGYHIEAVRRKFAGKIIVIEPDLSLLKTALSCRSLGVLKDVTLIAGASPQEAVERLDRENDDLDPTSMKLIHLPASIRLHEDYFEQVKRTLTARRKMQVSNLGILIVTPVYGGSLPVARFCASAFERLGHRVEMLDNSIYNEAYQGIDSISSDRNHRGQLTGMMTTLMAESITAKALDRAVDLVFLTAQSPMTPQVATELRRHKIPTAFWFVEDWQLFTYWQQWAPLYDYFFTIQKGGFPQALSNIGVKRTSYLPLAADPQVHHPIELSQTELEEYGSDVSHLGAGYRNRQQVFSGLTDLDFKLWGNGWEDTSLIRKVLQRNGERLSTEETAKVFNAAKININLHSSQFHLGVNPEGDYLNPRTFEIAACGGFQLIDRRSLLPELFKAGEEVVVFDHEIELRGLIEHYLAHPEERRAIAARSRQRVLAEHTYEIRMAEMLDYIYSYETSLASRQHPNHIENLLEEGENDPELTKLLKTYAGSGTVTVDDIASQIQKKKSAYDDAESTFLLMYEFRNWAREKDLV